MERTLCRTGRSHQLNPGCSVCGSAVTRWMADGVVVDSRKEEKVILVQGS